MPEKISLSFFNIGAIIGAVVGVLLTLALWYSLEWDIARRDFKFGALLPIVGYFLGSFGWSWAFPEKEE
jgi:hypothetical protein